MAPMMQNRCNTSNLLGKNYVKLTHTKTTAKSEVHLTDFM